MNDTCIGQSARIAFEAMNDNDGMEGRQTEEPDPGPTPVGTHVIPNHHRADDMCGLGVRLIVFVSRRECRRW